MKTVKMVMLRNYTHRSVLGHSVRFEKEQPTDVPAVLVEEVMLAGAVPVDVKDLEQPEETPEDPAPVGPERTEAFFGAFATLKAANERDTFTAGGRPKKGPLEAELGFKTDTREINDMWAAFEDKGREN